MIGQEEGAERPHTAQRVDVYDDFAHDAAVTPFSRQVYSRLDSSGRNNQITSANGGVEKLAIAESPVRYRTDAGMTRRLSENALIRPERHPSGVIAV